MPILEMEKLKKAYPAYKDIPDERLLQHIVKKYPVYAPIAEREFGAIKETPPTLKSRVQDIAKPLAEKVAPIVTDIAKKTITPLVQKPMEAFKAFQEIERPRAGLRSIAAGGSFMEGFMNPEKTPQFVDSVSKVAFRDWGIKDPEQLFYVSLFGGYALDLGTLHLMYGTIPKALKTSMKGVKSLYVGAQGKQLTKLRNVLTDEFKGAGMAEKQATTTADRVIWNQWQKTRFREKTPGSIKKAADVMEAHKGQLGSMMRKVKERADVQGFTKEWVKKAQDVGPSGMAVGAVPKVTPTLKDIKMAKAPVSPKVKVKAPVATGKIADMEDTLRVWKGQIEKEPKGPVRDMLEESMRKMEEKVISLKADSAAPKPPVISKIEQAKAPEAHFYHVTPKAKVEAIRREGILPGKPRQWKTPFGVQLGEKGQVYAFSDYEEAVRWAARMEWGTKKPVSVLQLKDLEGFKQDTATGAIVGKWWKKGEAIPKEKIIRDIELTPELKKQLVSGKLVSPTEVAKVKPVTKYSPTSTYNVEYKTPAGVRETMMRGTQLNDIETQIAAGQVPRDSRGTPIIGIVDTFGVKGQAGFINVAPLAEFEDTFQNLMGEAEKASSSFKQLSKKIGTPFFIGQKYPAFKPVYTAVQDGIDYKSELFFEGQHILQPQKLMKLPQSSQRKLSDVIKLGNSAEVQRWFNDEELARKFNFNVEEVMAYKRVKKLYNFVTQMEVKARKAFMDFDAMEPDRQMIANEAIQQQVAKLGGYVSQTRIGGQWAVYAPPDEEGGIARFFNLYKTKSEALHAQESIPNSKVYLKDDALKRGFHRNLTVADLENLIEASDVNTSSADIKALREELRKRGFAAHWIQRKNVPGPVWDWPNILGNAVDYLEGGSNKLSRVIGRGKAEQAFRTNVKAMTPELRAYARDFVDLFYNTGSIGIKSLNQIMYTYKLAFKTSWLAMNLAQPLSTTYPLGAKYLPGLENEKTFIKSYDMAWRYFFHRWKGKPHGISSELIGLLDKLHRQGALGDQMTRFQLAVKGLSTEQYDKWIGLYGRLGEGINRAHAGIEGYFITEKLGIKGKAPKLEFMKEFIYKTQFAYGKHNLPQWITSAGSARNLARTAYTFRHFTVSYLQLLNSMMPWRGAKMGQAMRAMGVLLAQAGIKGLPFMGLVALGYKMMRGRTMEHDIRAKAEEYNIPSQAVDVALGGAYTMAGVDASMLIGVGDVIPTFSGVMGAILGAPYGTGQQLAKAAVFASRGDYAKALENASPDAIRNILRARRYAVEGIRKMSGELIASPSKLDIFLRGLGLTPMGESKPYAAREAKATIQKHGKDISSEFHRRLAWAIHTKDKKERRSIITEIGEHNRKVSISDKVIISEPSIMNWLLKFKGKKDIRAPIKLRKEFREIDKLYGIRK